MIPAFVISLESEPERRRHILEECARCGITPAVIDAVDLRQAGEEEVRQLSALPVKKKTRKQKPLRKGEVGCALSHQAAYRRLLAGTQRYALILEDDAEFVRNPAALLEESVLDDIARQHPFDILLIGYVKKRPEDLPVYFRCIPLKPRAAATIGDTTHTFGTPWEQYACGTVAYIITRAGAEKLAAANSTPCVTADDYLYFEQHYNLRVLHCRPTFVLEAAAGFPSTVANFRPVKQHFFRVFKGRLKHFAMNTLGLK